MRLREVMHYQEMQKIRTLGYALVGVCVPMGRTVLPNWLSDGIVIVNELQVCGLVESLLGVAQDANDGFGSGQMVARFLRNANAVMSVDEWSELPAAERKVVEDANNLGMTLEELPDKLMNVAEVELSSGDETHAEQLIIEEVDHDKQRLDG